MKPGEGVRTLVVPPMQLHGAVLSLPVLRSLSDSGRHLTVLAPRFLHSFYEMLPTVDEVVDVTDAEERTVSDIRRCECEEAVLLDESLDSAWLARSAGIPKRWGYRGRLRTLFLKPAVRRDDTREEGSRRYAELMTAMGLDLFRWVPELSLPDEVKERGPALLERARVPMTSGPLVGLVPVPDHRLTPRWPWQHFAQLARLLRRRNPAVRQILLAGSEELWPVVRIHEETARFYPVLGPDLDMASLAAVVGQLQLLVGHECGITELAAALGVPCVLILQPGHHMWWPLGRGHRRVEGETSPAWVLATLLGRSAPLAGIEVEEVLGLCERTLSKKGIA